MTFPWVVTGSTRAAAGTGRHAHAGGTGILGRPIQADRLVLRRHGRWRSVRSGDASKCACRAGVPGQLRPAAGERALSGAPPRKRRARRSRDAQPLGPRAPVGRLPAATSPEPAARGAASHHRRGRAGATARRLAGAAGGGAAQHALGGVPEQPLPADALVHSDGAADAVAAGRDDRGRFRGRRARLGVDPRPASLAGDGALQSRRARGPRRARVGGRGPRLAGPQGGAGRPGRRQPDRAQGLPDADPRRSHTSPAAALRG